MLREDFPGVRRLYLRRRRSRRPWIYSVYHADPFCLAKKAGNHLGRGPEEMRETVVTRELGKYELLS
jgi:hypothetical protein